MPCSPEDSGMSGRLLTPKEQQFVAEYLVDRNGAADARRAGYAAKSAKITAARLLRQILQTRCGERR
jgi:hypothetical protein